MNTHISYYNFSIFIFRKPLTDNKKQWAFREDVETVRPPRQRQDEPKNRTSRKVERAHRSEKSHGIFIDPWIVDEFNAIAVDPNRICAIKSRTWRVNVAF